MLSGEHTVPPITGRQILLNDIEVELDLHIIRYTIPSFGVQVWAFALQLQHRDQGIVIFAYNYPDKGGIVFSHMSLLDSKDVIYSIRKPLLETWDLLLLDCKGYRGEEWESNVHWFLGVISALHTERIMPSEKFDEWSDRLRRPPVPVRLELQMSAQSLQMAFLSTIDRDDLTRILVHLERCEVPTNNLRVVGQSVGALKKRPGPARLSTDRCWGADFTVHWHVHAYVDQRGEHYLKPTIGVGPQLARYLSDPKVNLRGLLQSLQRTIKKPLISIEGRTPVAVSRRSKLHAVPRLSSPLQPRTSAPITRALARLYFRREIECKADTAISAPDLELSLRSDAEMHLLAAPAARSLPSRLYLPSLAAGHISRMTVSDKMMEDLARDFDIHAMIRENNKEEEQEDDDDDGDVDDDEQVTCSGMFRGFIGNCLASQANSSAHRSARASAPQHPPATAVSQQTMQRQSVTSVRRSEPRREQLALINSIGGPERTLPLPTSAVSVSPSRQVDSDGVKKRPGRGPSRRPPRPPQ